MWELKAMMIRGIASWLLAMVLSASAAHAHGGLSGLARTSSSSPDTSRKIPGMNFATISQLDMQDSELRDMLTSASSGMKETDAELGSPQIPHVLPKTYPTGTLTFEHTFPEIGKFIGIVTVKNVHGQAYVSQFLGQGFGKSRGSMPRWSRRSSARFTCYGAWAGSRSSFPRKSRRA